MLQEYEYRIYTTLRELQGYLEIHLEKLHDKQLFECPICDANFTGKGILKRHISTVHESKKPFKCSECEASFSQTANMRSHLSHVHGWKNPYQCISCNECFNSNSDLKEHSISMH